MADEADNTDEIIAAVWELGMNPVMPRKSNRREKRGYDRALYQLRHLVKKGFLAICQIRDMVIWTRSLLRQPLQNSKFI